MTTSPSLAQDAADRLAVVEALYRFAAGIDLRDRKLLGSSLARMRSPTFGLLLAKPDSNIR